MRYSIKPRDAIYNKGYGILSFTKNVGKTLSNKYGQKLLDSANKSTTNAIKTASKRAIQKTAEATGNLIGNKIADEINTSKKSLACSQNDDANSEIEAQKKKKKKKYISPEEKQIIDEIRLV